MTERNGFEMKRRFFRRGLAAMLSALMLASACGAFPASAASAPTLGLTLREDGTVLLAGKPYYAMGVNYYDAFLIDLRERADYEVIEAEFAQLQKSKIPLARVEMCGYYPNEFWIYLETPDYYFEKMDRVVALAEKYEIGLVVDLFWLWHAVADVALERLSEMGNPQSKTVALSKQYATDVVNRYKDSPAVWMWEIGNEYNLMADLETVMPPDFDEYCTPGYGGCQGGRNEEDIANSDDIHVFYEEIGKTIRALDPNRLITGGDSEPRNAAYNLKMHDSWQLDTFEEMSYMMELLSPAPLNTMSVHVYQDDAQAAIENYDEQVGRYMQAAKNAKQALFVGEFGIMDTLTQTLDKAKQILKDQYNAFMKHGVQLSCIWVYGKDDGDEMNISPTNERAYQYNMVVNANIAYRDQGKQDSDSYWDAVTPLLYKGDTTEPTAAPTTTKAATTAGRQPTTTAASTAATTATESTQLASTTQGAAETTPSSDSSSVEANAPDNGGSIVGWIVGILIGVLVLGGGTLAIVLYMKKKKEAAQGADNQ